ncbi:hypothetical protein OBBRIDRAFT_506646 [Obba rivulosa]|uniref:Uncharacterized protein n=1 Tax=Obba rivulosa TaxID=1052685 RepID=A0A8E2AWE9_9APHY|nr:hypothetical protein OBBRIDRAFT_506646 [Obba rivulosa]
MLRRRRSRQTCLLVTVPWLPPACTLQAPELRAVIPVGGPMSRSDLGPPLAGERVGHIAHPMSCAIRQASCHLAFLLLQGLASLLPLALSYPGFEIQWMRRISSGDCLELPTWCRGPSARHAGWKPGAVSFSLRSVEGAVVAATASQSIRPSYGLAPDSSLSSPPQGCARAPLSDAHRVPVDGCIT